MTINDLEEMFNNTAAHCIDELQKHGYGLGDFESGYHQGRMAAYSMVLSKLSGLKLPDLEKDAREKMDTLSSSIIDNCQGV